MNRTVPSFDVIVVGAGLNGLTAAAYLSKAGKRVLVLEKAHQVGGTLGTVDIAPGFRGPAAVDSIDLVHPSILDDFDLRRRGLRVIRGGGIILASEEGPCLYFDSETPTADQAARFSASDGKAFRELGEFLDRLSRTLEPALYLPLADPSGPGVSGALGLLKLGWSLRRMGGHDMTEALRFLPMSIRDVLDERFESEPFKALIAATALRHSPYGPRAAGTAFGLLHHNPHWAGGWTGPRHMRKGGQAHSPDCWQRLPKNTARWSKPNRPFRGSCATAARRAASSSRTAKRIRRM